MKVKVSYEFDATYGLTAPYWAKGYGLVASGVSYAVAREKLIKAIKHKLELEQTEPFPDEEIEI